MSKEQYWQQFLCYLSAAPILARARLQQLCPVPPARELSASSLRRALDDQNLNDLFIKHLLSYFLVVKPESEEPPAWLHDLLKRTWGISFARLAAHTWIGIPILTVQGTTHHTTWVLLGEGSGDVDRSSSLFSILCADNATRRYLAQALGRDDPMIIHLSAGPGLQGPSLQLPLALGRWLLENKLTWPHGLRATGALSTDHLIDTVGSLEEKFQHAVREGCRLLLGPATNSPRLTQDLRYRGCVTLRDARLSAYWFTVTESQDRIDLYLACLGDPRVCCRHLPALPADFFDLPESAPVQEWIRTNIGEALPLITEALENKPVEPALASHLDRLVSPERLCRLLKNEPDMAPAGFAFSMTRISLANHAGEPEDGQPWQQVADELYPILAASGDLGEYLNRRLVQEQFNRYDFHARPPAALERFIAEEEARNRVAHRDSRTLGAIYGTLAQLAGFRGPAHFSELKKYLHLARLGFGNRYRNESERLDNYLAYALLDMDRIQEAEKVLCRYLETTSIQEWLESAPWKESRPDGSVSFRLSLCLRFLAEQEEIWPADSILEEIQPLCRQHRHHPWQLTSLNLGRMYLACNRSDEAAAMFRLSVRRCLAGGPTMRPMALLGLACLHLMEQSTPDELAEANQLRLWLAEEAPLNRKHFQDILDKEDSRTMLKNILDNKNKYFPFSYR